MTIETPNILLIDSYDSFTFNLASLCRLAIPGCTIHIIKNDQFKIHELLPLLKGFSAVIVGPGPGSPGIEQDIGVVKHLWKIPEDQLLPVFGVCLGLQSLAIEYGARLKRLDVVKHGQVSRVMHEGRDLFEGVGEVDAVRYHSLCVEVEVGGEIETLAWADDGVEENGVVVMAVKHRYKPFWGVQYHPESVLTEGGGLKVLQNFWKLASQWSRKRGRGPLDSSVLGILGHPWPHINSYDVPPSHSMTRLHVQMEILEKIDVSIPGICEMLGVRNENSPFVMLDSAANPGQFSIIASLMPASLQILYSIGDPHVTLKRGNTTTYESLGTIDIWSWLGDFMRYFSVDGGSEEVPFWGGLIGMLSYELGVHSLDVPLRSNRMCDGKRHYDVNLVFVERSVVVDSKMGRVYVQSVVPGDEAWIAGTIAKLRRQAAEESAPALEPTIDPKASSHQQQRPTVQLPDRDLYISRIHEAKAYLRSGDSYELCLTANTHLTLPKTISSWDRYKLLRKTNPAPYSAYIRLNPTTFLSSSPERFLSYSRPPESLCQLRPIKGTIRKSGSGAGINRAYAEKALRGSNKEVAENLMIVDLIRHDLHGVVGLDVVVKQFCSVEEYETVWQMVSVIEGRLPSGMGKGNRCIGWEVLGKSLPPGSMTGAPKKRSVEILQTLEDEDRSIYSGVFGYWCVGGGGDWSVVIRSCFKHDLESESESENVRNDNPSTESERWTVGAGGAITALSDPEAEWEEMVVKLQSVLGAFGVADSDSDSRGSGMTRRE